MELELSAIPLLAKRFSEDNELHPVMRQVPAFLAHVRRRVEAQGRRLGIAPSARPSTAYRAFAMAQGAGLFVRSQFAKPSAPLLRSYLRELGF